jgi:hypothetical protein
MTRTRSLADDAVLARPDLVEPIATPADEPEEFQRVVYPQALEEETIAGSKQVVAISGIEERR